MPKILYSPASPFASKARMAAAYSGYSFEPELTKTDEVPADLIAANPLGKIPALVTDDGKGNWKLSRTDGIKKWKSADADTERIWWSDTGVHQNLTFAVQPALV